MGACACCRCCRCCLHRRCSPQVAAGWLAGWVVALCATTQCMKYYNTYNSRFIIYRMYLRWHSSKFVLVCVCGSVDITKFRSILPCTDCSMRVIFHINKKLLGLHSCSPVRCVAIDPLVRLTVASKTGQLNYTWPIVLHGRSIGTITDY